MPRRKWQPRSAVISIAAVLGLAVAGCGGDDEIDVPPGFLTPEEATAEYFAEAANWELPDGWTWPEDPGYGAFGAAEGGGAFFEETSGKIDATWYWYCAWVWTLVEADAESDRVAILQEVLRVRETPYYQIGLDGTAYVDRNLDAAEAGDFQPLSQYASVNCPR